MLILGKGHIGYRLKRQLCADNFDVFTSSADVLMAGHEEESVVESVNTYVQSLNPESLSMIYLLDDKDETNLQLIIILISLYPDVPITASLFNENLIPHLLVQGKNLSVINPAKLAAPHFVKALYHEVERREVVTVPQHKAPITPPYKISLIEKLLILFALILCNAVLFFHFEEHLPWMDAIYFVIVTAATVGYGDISMIHSDVSTKIAVILLIFSSTVLVWMIFSLTIDAFLKRRIQLSLGRKKYHLKNHIVVCGLGRLGFFVVEELLRNNERVIIIETNEQARHLDYFRHLGAEVYIGDGRQTKVLDDVNIAEAKALISVINNDSMNLEIGLNARTFQPDLRLILRIFEEKMAEKIKNILNIHLSISASVIVEGKLFQILKEKQQG